MSPYSGDRPDHSLEVLEAIARSQGGTLTSMVDLMRKVIKEAAGESKEVPMQTKIKRGRVTIVEKKHG